jgi:aminoglycoside phosphotransferase (APT) family kinase protein
MSQPWAAETIVDPALAAALLEEQFPDLAPVSVAALGAGWDNTAYLVNGSYVVRFPRRAIAVPLLEAEARLLPWIAGRVPLAVPVPVLVGRPGARFAWPFLGYRELPGTTACRLALDDGARTAAAPALGSFLAALHALPVAEARARGAGGDTIGRLELADKVPTALARLDDLAGTVPPAEATAARALIAASAGIHAPAGEVLVHGDLYARHLLLDAGARPCGVIDWGDVHVGHPAVDLSLALGFLPPAARPAFLRAYGRTVDPATWRLARFRALWSALAIVGYGRDVGDADLVREGGRALEHACAA